MSECWHLEGCLDQLMILSLNFDTSNIVFKEVTSQVELILVDLFLKFKSLHFFQLLSSLNLFVIAEVDLRLSVAHFVPFHKAFQAALFFLGHEFFFASSGRLAIMTFEQLLLTVIHVAITATRGNLVSIDSFDIFDDLFPDFLENLLSVNNRLALLSIIRTRHESLSLCPITVVRCHFLQECNVSFRELFDDEFIHQLGLSLVEPMVDVMGFGKGHLVLQENLRAKIRFELGQIEILVLFSVKTFHFWMVVMGS